MPAAIVRRAGPGSPRAARWSNPLQAGGGKSLVAGVFLGAVLLCLAAVGSKNSTLLERSPTPDLSLVVADDSKPHVRWPARMPAANVRRACPGLPRAAHRTKTLAHAPPVSAGARELAPRCGLGPPAGRRGFLLREKACGGGPPRLPRLGGPPRPRPRAGLQAAAGRSLRLVISRFSSRSIAISRESSSLSQRLIAAPDCPARPERPMRWT